MYIQERANFVIRRHKQNMADTTDVPHTCPEKILLKAVRKKIQQKMNR